LLYEIKEVPYKEDYEDTLRLQFDWRILVVTTKMLRTTLLTSVLVSVVLLGACSPGPAPTPALAPMPTPAAQDRAFRRLEERIQTQARTPAAREFVALFFPQSERECTRDEEIKAWIITLTSFNPEYYTLIRRMSWFKGDLTDASQYYSDWSDPVWIVYDDGNIMPLFSAKVIEADIEDLNLNQTLIPDPPKSAAVAIPEGRGGPVPLPVSERVVLASYGRDPFYNPKYSSNTQSSFHASVAFALAERDAVELILESDIPIDWGMSKSGPQTKIGVLFAEMRIFSAEGGWQTISSHDTEIRNVSATDEGRRLEILLSPTVIAGSGFNPPGKGLFKILAVNLDLKRPHNLTYRVDIAEFLSPVPAPSSTPAPKLAPSRAPTPTPAPKPVPTTTPSAPKPAPNLDRNHLYLVPRESLSRDQGFQVVVAPADYRVIPISVGEYEHLVGWNWNAKGRTEDYLDSWLVDSTGRRISESGRSFNFGTDYAFGDSQGLPPGTYYIYLSNEFTAVSDKTVTLRVVWR